MAVTVITGAWGGMGLACTDALRDGPLLLVDIDPAALERATARAPHAVTARVDLGSLSAVAALGEEVGKLGGLRHLIHLAGVSPSMDDVDRILQVDLIGSAALLSTLLARATSGGVVVCVASIAAHLVPLAIEVDEALDDPLAPELRSRLESALGSVLDSGLAYSLAKRGLVRLCERAGSTWGARGARVVSISPGLIDTPMGRLELEANERKRSLIGLTPVAAPDDDGSTELPGRNSDVADVVKFLVSPRARFISGCDLRVDGGLVGALRSLEPVGTRNRI